MAKNSNPVEAHRKAMRKKELQRNKDARAKTREVITLKKDTGALDAEVRKLTQAEQAKELDAAGLARLKEVREEAEKVKKAKADFVKANPDAEDIVYKREKEREKARQAERQANGQGDQRRGGPGVSIYGVRSVFYHEVLNPLGHPPPGMYDQERPSDEMFEASSSDGDSDSDIVMPEGSPSGANGDDSDSDDSIVMPEGDAPPEARLAPPPGPPMPLMTPVGPPMFAPYRPNFGQPPFYPGNNFRPPPQGFGTGSNHMPLPPPGFFPSNGYEPGFRPGFRPPQQRPGGMHQDPLSNVPHTTFQAHRVAKQEEAAFSGNRQAPGGNTPPVAAVIESGPQLRDVGKAPVNAVIEAAPQLRDFGKEAAAFVPRAAKKKKTAASAIQVDAAPSQQTRSETDRTTQVDAPLSVAEEKQEKPAAPVYNPAAGGLMGKLSGILGSAPAPVKPQDDYQSFLAGLDNLPQ